MSSPASTGQSFKYDVAFSFLSRDLSLAEQLAAALSPLRVFVYSRQQEDLIAAPDGMEAFRSVFRDEVRLAVVLYRDPGVSTPGWGRTPWTGVEESAIRDRALRTKYQNFLIIALDTTNDLPPWIPSTNLHLDLQSFGFQEAVGVIRRKAQEEGAELRAETVREQAARLAKVAAAEQERLEFLESHRGVSAAAEELKRLFEHLEREVAALLAEGSLPELRFERHGYGNAAAVSSARAGFVVEWIRTYQNSLRHTELTVTEYARPISFSGVYRGSKRSGPVSKSSYTFNRALGGRLGWSPAKEPASTWSSEELAGYHLKRVIDRTHKKPARADWE